MSSDVRAQLKAAVDAAVRARMIESLPDMMRCGSCSCPLDCQTVGCRRCYERHYLRQPGVRERRRANEKARKQLPENRARAVEYSRRYEQKRRAMKLEQAAA